MRKWQVFSANFVEASLYLAALLLPLSGWLFSAAAGKNTTFWFLFNINMPGITPNKALATLAKNTHTYLAITILISLHILGAIKHSLIDKDGLFERMWFKSRR